MEEIKTKYQAALDQKFMTVSEVAELLRQAPETIRYWAWKGVGPKSFKCGRRRLYDVADVEAFIAAARRGSDEAAVG